MDWEVWDGDLELMGCVDEEEEMLRTASRLAESKEHIGWGRERRVVLSGMLRAAGTWEICLG